MFDVAYGITKEKKGVLIIGKNGEIKTTTVDHVLAICESSIDRKQVLDVLQDLQMLVQEEISKVVKQIFT